MTNNNLNNVLNQMVKNKIRERRIDTVAAIVSAVIMMGAIFAVTMLMAQVTATALHMYGIKSGLIAPYLLISVAQSVIVMAQQRSKKVK